MSCQPTFLFPWRCLHLSYLIGFFLSVRISLLLSTNTQCYTHWHWLSVSCALSSPQTSSTTNPHFSNLPTPFSLYYLFPLMTLSLHTHTHTHTLSSSSLLLPMYVMYVYVCTLLCTTLLWNRERTFFLQKNVSCVNEWKKT